MKPPKARAEELRSGPLAETFKLASFVCRLPEGACVYELETDYLVVGAGASGMAFVDALLSHSDSEVVLVDRRHRPGGHWLHPYTLVRRHHTAADSRVT